MKKPVFLYAVVFVFLIAGGGFVTIYKKPGLPVYPGSKIEMSDDYNGADILRFRTSAQKPDIIKYYDALLKHDGWIKAQTGGDILAFFKDDLALSVEFEPDTITIFKLRI